MVEKHVMNCFKIIQEEKKKRWTVMISKHVQSISKKGNGHLGLTAPHATLNQTLMLSSDEQDPVLMGDMVVVSVLKKVRIKNKLA